MCAVICRKSTVARPGANFLSSWCQSLSFRAQNRGFCAFLPFGTLIFGRFEHKIGIFVLFLPSGPPFSGLLSTKSVFLCQKEQFSPGFYPFRAQNRHFCALFAFGTTIFWPFEHKIGIFVRFLTSGPLFSGVPSIKSGFLCAYSRKYRVWKQKSAQIFFARF